MELTANGNARMVALLGASLLLHAGFVALLGKASRARSPISQQPLEVAVIEKPAPPPPESPAKPVPIKVARAPRVPAADLPPPRAAPRRIPAAPPPPSREAREEHPQPIVLPGITFESTSQASSFAVPAGNTLYGQPSSTAIEPAEVKPYKADRYVPASQVNELPGVESRPDSLRPFYPEAARRRGVQGDVVLRLLIDADGSLAKVDVIREPGGGLGAAGAQAIRQFRFRPAKVDGRPVATTITYVLHFVLD
jgi:periplasmic protein TonB